MNIDYLVHMANRIGEFFQAIPDHDEALQGIATHVQKFWEPRMREQLAEHLAGGGLGLSLLVKEAFARHAAVLARQAG